MSLQDGEPVYFPVARPLVRAELELSLEVMCIGRTVGVRMRASRPERDA